MKINDHNRNNGRAVAPGDRVEISPSHDLWIRGARFGEVVKIVEGVASVKMDHKAVKTHARVFVDELKIVK